MLHSVQWLFLIMAQVKVVPEKSVSMVVSANNYETIVQSDLSKKARINALKCLKIVKIIQVAHHLPLRTSVSQRAITSVSAAWISVPNWACLNK